MLHSSQIISGSAGIGAVFAFGDGRRLRMHISRTRQQTLCSAINETDKHSNPK